MGNDKTKINHAERTHSKLGASKAKQWLNCPRSIKLSEQAPKQLSNDYADDGFHAHELAEYVLKNEISIEELWAMPTFKSKPIDDEKKKAVQVYVEYIRNLQK